MSIANDYYSEAPAAAPPRRQAASRAHQRPTNWLRKSYWSLLIKLSLASGAVAVAVVAYVRLTDTNVSTANLIHYTAKRDTLKITVTERGNLQSQENIKVFCEVDDVRGDGIDGTPILWVIPNGASVESGDLLIEFDDSGHRGQLDAQILAAERAEAEFLQAEAKFENQKTQNQTNSAQAELAVRLAELELEMFQDDSKGTHRLEVEEIQRSIDDLQNEILSAQTILKLKQHERQGIEALFKMGYSGKSELDRSRLEVLQAQSEHAAKLNRLTTYRATLEKKESYEYQMQILRLEGAVETADRARQQVALDNRALLAQAEAQKNASERSLKKEREILERYRSNIARCRVTAPQSGMVAYAEVSRWRSRDIVAGALAYERQHMLSLPNLDRMQVETAVHESVLDQVKQGLPATISIDAFPNLRYRGTVKSVAVMPDTSGMISSDTKVYKTVVTIDEDVTELKPGMTAVVEIHIDEIPNVVAVPVQAIVQRENKSWCYVGAGSDVERRSVRLGKTNDQFVQIIEGVEPGEEIVLNPMALIDDATSGPQKALEPAEQTEPAESTDTGSQQLAQHAP